ncbi:hypothetical protein D3C76_761240 [compost metagenome]
MKIRTVDIVFAGPLHPHRFAGEFLGQDRRFDDEVGFGFAPEATAQQRHVERNVIEGHAQAFTDPLAGDLWRLAWPPGFAHSVLVASDGDHRLHWRL